MASYTHISPREAEEILKLYGKNKVLKCTPLSLGISNSNYRVDLEDEIVLLKISNDKNQKQLADEQAILIYLNERGYPYSLKPFALPSGDYIYSYGPYFGVLYPFVEGIPPGPSDYTCQEVGKSLAELHSLKHDQQKLKALRPHQSVGFGANEILAYLSSPSAPEDYKSTFLHLFPDKLKSYQAQNFAEGIIHGDLYYDNTLFNNNHLSSVLDFEQAGIGEYILDLGISISGTCLEKGRVITPLVKSFLVGYESLRPLPEDEKKFLHESIMLGLLSISLWRIKRFKEGNLNPQMEDSYKELLWRASNYFELIKFDNN